MKIRILPLLVLLASLFVVASGLSAEISPALKIKVNSLVHHHYVDGINYDRARALGSEAVPYLAELLNDPDQKEYWVNIIVTMGFIEDPSALAPLTQFLESADGEVDVQTLRALLSIPYAVGCIASAGDREALAYLDSWVDSPEKKAVTWRFGKKNIREMLYNQSVLGLAVTGLPEAAAKLSTLREQNVQPAGRQTRSRQVKHRADTLDMAGQILARIQKDGRAAVLSRKADR